MDDRLALPADTALVGSYRIMRVVGSGGFGITYEAEDTGLGAVVAIKEYYPFDFGDRDAAMSVVPKSERHKQTFDWGRANFLREARTLARFDHPSIVRVTRVFEANSTAYMVMRFEHGLSLEAWLAARGRPPTQEQLDLLAAPLLDALQMIHAADFLHGDIAPDNILIRADGTPVLLDFGSARRAVAEMSRSPTGIVKAGYSPHEQYSSDGRLLGSWSDIYALGGTFYRAVAGHPPEEATLRLSEDRMAPAAQVAKASYRPGFLNAIDWSLSLSSRDRPGSIAEWRNALLGGDRTQSPPPWHPPEQSGTPERPLEIADLRQWSQMVAAAQTDGLMPSAPAAPATRLAERANRPYGGARAGRGDGGFALEVAPRRCDRCNRRDLRPEPPQSLRARRLRAAARGDKSQAQCHPFHESLAREGAIEADRDLVDCSVFSPPAAPPGSTVLVQAFLHVKSDATRVSVLASLMDTATALKGVQTLQAEIPRGARVDLTISAQASRSRSPCSR